MDKCINTKHPEFIELAKQANMNPLVLKSKIGVWQENNNSDDFPTLEELRIGQEAPNLESDNNIKEGVSELFESNPTLANAVYEALGVNIPNLPIVDTENITSFEGTGGAAQYDRKNSQIKVNRKLLKQKFSEQAWTKPRKLIEILHGEQIESYAQALPENQFTTYQEWEQFVINHEYQHSLYSRQDFDKEFPNKTKGDYESEINRRALRFNKTLLTPQQKQQAQQLYSEYLEQNPNGSVEQFKSWVDSNQSNVLYQLPQGREIEEFVASEKTIRDLAARMSDRIGIPTIFESDRSKKYKGNLENGTAVVNLAYATLDTPIHEILGHPIIRAIKNKKGEHFNTWLQKTKPELFKRFSDKEFDFYSDVNKEFEDFILEITPNYIGEYKEYLDNKQQLYQNLLKELEYGKGKEVLDRVKRDYVTKEPIYSGSIDGGKGALISKGGKYTLEEQQEEALVELLGLMTAEKLDKVKDGKLISLLKRLLKEMKAFMKQLLGQKEVEIDKLPDNMTLGDIADLLAYSNSKLILPGNEVVYTTPDNQQFKTYAEASKHISELAKSVEDVDLSNISIPKTHWVTWEEVSINHSKPEDPYQVDYYNKDFMNLEDAEKFVEDLKNRTGRIEYSNIEIKESNESFNHKSFIEKNKEYEQAKEIIEEWKKINNIQYNPEEVYSRGQEFVSVVGAYSDFDVNLMMQNLLQHIEDNQKAGGEFTISAFTKPTDRKIGHLEDGGGKIKFKIYPQSKDIKWAANTDVFSGSVWDASEKVNKDKKSELLGVSYTKYPSLRHVNAVQPNLASIIDNLANHHNELGISLTGSNFRLEYDENIPYSTKKLINSINSILDQKYGKLVKPDISTKDTGKVVYRVGAYFSNTPIAEFNSKEEAQDFINKYKQENANMPFKEDLAITPSGVLKGIQPTQTNETLKESIKSVTASVLQDKNEFIQNFKLNNDIYETKYKGDLEYYTKNNKEISFEEFHIMQKEYRIKNKKEYTEQALINAKIAKLKEVAKIYPRSLIVSEVRPISSNSNLGFVGDELPFQKAFAEGNKTKKGVQELFESNPELASIGNQQQYSQYLDTITNEDIVYKGFKNKAGYIHNTPNHSFFTNSFNIADKWYNDNTGIKTFAIPKVSVESYKATTNKGISTLRKQEEEYINNSKAGLIKLETNDIGGLQTQYVVNKKYQPLELGSKEDLEGFKEFIKGSNNSSQQSQQSLAPKTLEELSRISLQEAYGTHTDESLISTAFSEEYPVDLEIFSSYFNDTFPFQDYIKANPIEVQLSKKRELSDNGRSYNAYYSLDKKRVFVGRGATEKDLFSAILEYYLLENEDIDVQDILFDMVDKINSRDNNFKVSSTEDIIHNLFINEKMKDFLKTQESTMGEYKNLFDEFVSIVAEKGNLKKQEVLDILERYSRIEVAEAKSIDEISKDYPDVFSMQVLNNIEEC